MALIKRYSNRKLYDSDARRYITLEEIGDAVRRGEDIQVIDHASGTDLTTLTLVQVLLLEEKRLGGLLPHRLLARLIRSGDVSFGSLRDSIQGMLDPHGLFERELHRRIEHLLEQKKFTQPEADRLFELLTSPAAIDHLSIPPLAAETATSADIQALMVELDRLDQALEELR